MAENSKIQIVKGTVVKATLPEDAFNINETYIDDILKSKNGYNLILYSFKNKHNV